MFVLASICIHTNVLADNERSRNFLLIVIVVSPQGEKLLNSKITKIVEVPQSSVPPPRLSGGEGDPSIASTCTPVHNKQEM